MVRWIDHDVIAIRWTPKQGGERDYGAKKIWTTRCSSSQMGNNKKVENANETF